MEQKHFYNINNEEDAALFAKAQDEGFMFGRSAQASYQGRSFVNIDTGLSARNEFTRSNYDFFRPSEAIPTDPKEIMAMCDEVCDRVGLVYYIISLMSTFPMQGIRPVHKNKKIENFYRKIWKKVRGTERSERFLNCLFRMGMVCSKRSTGKLKPSSVKKYMTAMGADLEELDVETPKVREIPVRYDFINPLTLEVIGGELCPFIGKFRYGVVIPSSIRKLLKKKSKTQEELELIAEIPQDILDRIQNTKSKYIILPNDKIQVFYYKKQDWKVWAKPITYSVLSDINVIEKMKLADVSALDSAISNIRVWTLGSLKDGIIPTPAAIDRLAALLTNKTYGGLDLIWTDDIKLIESKSEVHKFLGSEKYAFFISSVYAAFGFPQTMTAGGGGFTNNFVSIKTFIKLLEYARGLLIEFWEKEFEQVSLAMRGVPGFEELPRLSFEHINLGDETAEKALLLQLVDRKIMSREQVANRLGEDFEMETSRMTDDDKMVDKGKIKELTGPYPESSTEYKKILLNNGEVTPGEIGLELEDPKDGKIAPAQLRRGMEEKNLKISESKPKGIAGQGRPLGKKDGAKRPQKSRSTYRSATG